ncbi:hypothetical protein DBV15_09433 [Temnothorax longispinosus]|uniref:Uncharacterized protein n=1 Tax=Temnothorax longispinosus TaxID=300112 RepID=A0A4S2L0X7_9HYME|nr:hypothetical protein DBV15_09433 [Temnothorax longispinosus]
MQVIRVEENIDRAKHESVYINQQPDFRIDIIYAETCGVPQDVSGTTRVVRVIAETRTKKVVHGICSYFDFAAVLRYALGCSERDGYAVYAPHRNSGRQMSGSLARTKLQHVRWIIRRLLLRESRSHSISQTVSALTARSRSSSSDSTRRREALRQGFGSRTKAQSRSAAAPVAIFLNDQPIVESPWKLAHRKAARPRRHSCLPRLCSFTYEARHPGCWSPKVRRKS